MKENQKKISLTTYVITLIIMVAIIITLIFINLNQNNNIIQTSTNIEENTRTLKSVKSKKTVWEEYPDNLTEQISDWLLEDKTAWSTSFETQTMKKTLYSLSKKYSKSDESPFTKDYLSHLYIGDTTRIVDIESNYKQYEYDSDDEFINGYKVEKYTDIISYKIADFFEDFYLDPENNTLEESNFYQYFTIISDHIDPEYKSRLPIDMNLYREVPYMLVMNGNNTSEQHFKNNARAKKIKVVIDGISKYTFDLEDTNAVQVLKLDYMDLKEPSLKHPISITVEVLETYSGEQTNDVYISDVQFAITSNIPQGR